MALLKDVPTIYLFRRINEIEDELKDFFISWAKTQRLKSELATIMDELHERGYSTLKNE